MDMFWNTIGILMTQFLKGMSQIWIWLTNPIQISGVTLQIAGWEVIPIQVFGAGFIVVIGYSIIRSLTV